MTVFSKNSGGHVHFGTPGYAYVFTPTLNALDFNPASTPWFIIPS